MFNPFTENSEVSESGQSGSNVSGEQVEDKRVRGGERPYLVCEGGKCYRKGKRDWCLCFERIKKQRTSALLMIHGQEVKETGEVGETGHSWAKQKQLNFFCPPLTWSVEVLRWSGQRGGVAMATVHCINSKGAMACRFWDALPPIKALLSKRDQRCVKNMKCFIFTGRQNIQCNLRRLSGGFTSVASDTAPGD